MGQNTPNVPISAVPPITTAAQYQQLNGASPFLAQAAPGQPTIPPSLAPAPSPNQPFDIQQLYNSMQNYYQPLQQPLTLSAPALDDATMSALAQQMLAIQQGHALLNGTQPPNPASVLAKAQAHMSATEIAGKVGQQTWEQMVTDPIHQFLNTWQKDPKAGLLETLGGAAVIGGIIGLEALTGGAATPFIFAAGAALVAPGMISSWADEVQHPSDSNLVKALVNTSTGVLTVGMPGKFIGMAETRANFEANLVRMRNAVDPAQLQKMISGFGGSLKDLSVFHDITKQQELLASKGEEMKAQFEHLNVSMDPDTPGGKLLDMQMRLDSYGAAMAHAEQGDDQETYQLYKDKIEALLAPGESGEKSYGVLRQEVAYHYKFLSQQPYKHVPLMMDYNIASLTPKIVKGLQTDLGRALGFIHQLTNGAGLAEQKVAPALTSVVEMHANSLSGGHPESVTNEVALAHRRMMDAVLGPKRNERPVFEAGKEPDDLWHRASPYEQVEFGLEDPKLWDRLTPEQKLAGQLRGTLDNAFTIGNLKKGLISLALAGRVPRKFGPLDLNAETIEQLFRDPTAPTKGKVLSFERAFQLALDDVNTGEVNFNETRSRFDIFASEYEKEAAYNPETVAFLKDNLGAIAKQRKSYTGSQNWIDLKTRQLAEDPNNPKAKGWLESRDKAQAKLDALKGGGFMEKLMADGLDEATAQKVIDHVAMEGKALKKVKEAMPLNRRMITGDRLFNMTAAAAVFRLHSADFGDLYRGHAHTNNQIINDALLSHKQEGGGEGLLQTQSFLDQIGGKPDIVDSTVFTHGTGEIATKAKNAGYTQIHPQVGNQVDLHYQPALYARDDIAAKIQAAYTNSHSSEELHQGVMRALYKAVSVSKHYIMYSPAWHFLNVAGRTMAFILNDPAVAIPALQTIWGKGNQFWLDPAVRGALEAEFSQFGGRRANRFNVGRAVHRAAREDTGQTTFPGVLRTAAGNMQHAYETQVEDGFWRMVDDFQLMAFQYSKYHLGVKNPGMSVQEIGQISSLYANNLGGMVNPLYMNKMYKSARNLIWFAPSYWATFMRSMMSVAPGADRMSSFLGKYREGAATRFGAVPLKTLSDVGYREAVRMQRSWTMTYLVTAVSAANFLNIILGGRNLWENDEGHMFDINVDRAGSLIGQGPQAKGAATKHAYFSGMPMFRQAMDVANALGLGHDWGFGHQFGDANFQQANHIQQAAMLAGGLLDGIKAQGATKTAAPVQAAYGLLQGETLAGRARGVQRKEGGALGNLGALTAFIPGGSTVERVVSNPGQSVGQDVQSIAGSLSQQYTGLPSIYHLGVEEPPIDDDKMQSWVTQKNALHDSLNNASKQMFAGAIQPIQYERLRQQSVDKLLQLDADTFGASTPTGALSRARLDLEKANGLNRNDLTDSEWAERNDIFQMEWDQALQNASPATRAVWWEAETSQWTDADYLVWEAQQMRQAIMSAIDGQGGQHIRAYQHQIGPLLDIPSAAMRKALETGDPYYYAYRQTLKAMAQSSSLGAFINAFISPYSNTLIEPSQLDATGQQNLASVADSNATLLRPETAQALADEAKARAHSPAVEQAGGKASADPGFRKELADMAGSG